MNLNPLKIVQELKDDGFTEDQAELILKQLMAVIQESDLVDKVFLESKLAVLKADLIAEGARRSANLEITMADLDTKLAGRISESEKRTTAQITQLEIKVIGLETKIAESEAKMVNQVAESRTDMSGKISELKTDAVSKIGELKTDTANKLGELKIDVREFKIDVINRITESEKRMTGQFATLKEDMHKLEIRVITWMVGAQFTTIILILGMFYFFFSQILPKLLQK